MPTPYTTWPAPRSPFGNKPIASGDPAVALNAIWAEIISEVNGVHANAVVQKVGLRGAVLLEAANSQLTNLPIPGTYIGIANWAIMNQALGTYYPLNDVYLPDFGQTAIIDTRLQSQLQTVENATGVLVTPFGGA